MIFAGQIGGQSDGYTQASLLYLASLAAAGRRDVSVMPVQGGGIMWSTMPKWAQGIAQIGAQDNISTDTAIMHLTPDTLAYYGSPAKRTTIGLTVVETATVPRWLCRKLNQHTQALILTCGHNMRAFRAGGYTGAIHIVPHPMHEWLLDHEKIAAARAAAECNRYYSFLYVGGWNERKNPESVLRAYLRAFPKVGATRLLMKLTTTKSMQGYIDAIIESECGFDRPDVITWIEYMTEEQIQWLYEIADCYVSLHRGEGWGLGLHQAAVMGTPVIYTNWSAPAEFLSTLYGVPVDYKLVPASRMSGNMPFWQELEGLQWAEPSIESAVEAMRHMEQTRWRIAPSARLAMIEQYSLQNIGAALSAAVKAYE